MTRPPAKALVFGGSGLLGGAVCRALEENSIAFDAPRHADVDICNFDAVADCVRGCAADTVINLAAQANVDQAEREPEAAFAVNAAAAQNVALAAAQHDASVVHASTDYVFDGLTQRPYREVDPTGLPPSQYGQSKLLGEQLVRIACPRHFIVRVAALFGPGRRTFVDWVIEEATPSKPLRIVTDRFVSPSWTPDIAQQLMALMRTPFYGTYHFTGHGAASWHELAHQALVFAGADPDGVAPILDVDLSRELGGGAPRPPFSALDNFLLRVRGIEQMLDWQTALKRYVTTISTVSKKG